MSDVSKLVREYGSKAFFELKKHPFLKIEETQDGKKIRLYNKYVFAINHKDKVMWQETADTYNGEAFSLCTHQKEWKRILSFPSRTVRKFFEPLGYSVKGKELGKQVRIIISQAYKTTAQKMMQVLGGKLWQMYDRDIACLAMKCFGFSANSLDYTLVWNNYDDVADTFKKAPGVVPVWRSIFLDVVQGDKVFSDLPEIKRVIPNAIPLSSLFPLYRNLGFCFPNVIRVTKTFLESYGLTTAGWKFLVRLSPTHVRLLLKVRRRADWHHMTKAINFFAKVGEIPRFTLWRKILSRPLHETESYASVLRAAARHFQKSKKIKDEVHNFEDVYDWFVGENDARRTVVLDQNQLKADWGYFVRRERQWREEVAARNLGRRLQAENNTVWTSLINEMEVGTFRVVPIVGSHDLIKEGAIMKHCVGGFSHACLSNKSRIFSICQGEDRVATLELKTSEFAALPDSPKQQGLTWEMGQCRGKHNSQVSAEVQEVAKKVLAAYAKQQRKVVNEQVKVGKDLLADGGVQDGELHPCVGEAV